jgi:hypothetical protein
MKLFKCQACGQVLFFENTRCVQCARRVGYLPQVNLLIALEPAGPRWAAVGESARRYRFCRNADYDCCNWLIPSESADQLCAACRHNEIVPDLSQERNVALWRKIEVAKHRLFYSLLRLNLPLQTRSESAEGLAFDFLGDGGAPSGPKVLTGHDSGRITIALAEADDAERESRRSAMREPYRTLLGHFRHEIGHYYWDQLIRDSALLAPCRALFGDDARDYGDALKAYYDQGAPASWQERFVSGYAASHPWEDFAETWAHYLHIVDTLEMAHAFGVDIHPTLDVGREMKTHIDFEPYCAQNIGELVDAWLPLTYALNSINRCMGQPDLYPFILTPAIVDKLGFIHAIVKGAAWRPAVDLRDGADRLGRLQASSSRSAGTILAAGLCASNSGR